MKLPYTKNTTFTTFDKTISITALHQRVDRTRILEENIDGFQIPRGSGLVMMYLLEICSSLIEFWNSM
jgi:hypothetical protein